MLMGYLHFIVLFGFFPHSRQIGANSVSSRLKTRIFFHFEYNILVHSVSCLHFVIYLILCKLHIFFLLLVLLVISFFCLCPHFVNLLLSEKYFGVNCVSFFVCLFHFFFSLSRYLRFVQTYFCLLLLNKSLTQTNSFYFLTCNEGE